MGHPRPTGLIVWCVAIAALTIVRVIEDRVRGLADLQAATAEALKERLVANVVGTGATGAAWGIGCAWLYPPDDVLTQVFLIFVLGGITAGAAATRAPYFPVFIAYALPANLPILLRALSEFDRIHFGFAVLLGVFVLAMTAVAQRLSNAVIETIEQQAALTRARHAAEAASRAKSDFVAVVSHELRTPLTAIRGALGLVAEGHMGEVSGKAQRMVAIASRNSDRLQILIDDILDLASLEAGRLEFIIRREKILPIVRQTIDNNATYAAAFGATLSLVLDDVDDATSVDVDERRLGQVLTNLISNAAKFSPRGADVLLRISRRGSSVRIDVEDRGPGVPESFRPHLFQKFAQADLANDRRSGGTGLGLSISKTIVERFGGRIGYETPEAGGSRFYFELPVAS